MTFIHKNNSGRGAVCCNLSGMRSTRVSQKNILSSIYLLVLFLPLLAHSQPLLTLDNAMQLAVQNNYSLSLSQDQTEIANANLATAKGQFLPSASLGASTKGEFNSNPSVTSLYGQANWIIFSGLQNYHNYKQLIFLEKGAEFDFQAGLESLMESVITAYYNIVQQKQHLKDIEEILVVSGERNKLASAKLEIGGGTKLDQLQSVADLNEDSSSYYAQLITLNKARIALNQILAREAQTPFNVSDSIPLETEMDLKNWTQLILQNNSTLKAAAVKREAAVFNLNQVKGNWLPTVSTGLTYSAAPSAFNSSFTTQDPTLTYSASLSIPLFDKFTTSTGVRIAKIGIRQKETLVKQTESNVLGEFEQTKVQYQSGLQQINLETRNLQVAKLQAEAALERYRAGASSSVEFRDAQRILLDAELRVINIKQNVKQAETVLLRLAGLLIKRSSAPTESK